MRMYTPEVENKIAEIAKLVKKARTLAQTVNLNPNAIETRVVQNLNAVIADLSEMYFGEEAEKAPSLATLRAAIREDARY